MFLVAGENTPLSYTSDDDSSSLAVDVEGQMARFVTKILRVWWTSCTNLLYLEREAAVAVIRELSFHNQNKRSISISTGLKGVSRSVNSKI